MTFLHRAPLVVSSSVPNRKCYQFEVRLEGGSIFRAMNWLHCSRDGVYAEGRVACCYLSQGTRPKRPNRQARDMESNPSCRTTHLPTACARICTQIYMYIYIYRYILVHKYLGVYTDLCARMHLYIYICTHLCTHEDMCICMYVCMCMYVCKYVRMYVCT